MHNIGKMGVPDTILFKAESLDPEEFEIMRIHPFHTYEMLSPIQYLKPVLDIPYCHHEWWDGAGYSRRLKNEEIPLAARIFAVAEVYDALISDRPYRSPWTKGQADPEILKSYLLRCELPDLIKPDYIEPELSARLANGFETHFPKENGPLDYS